jgi:hypothetical protein
VLHRGAEHATSAPANLLMQLMFHPPARDHREVGAKGPAGGHGGLAIWEP